MTEARTHWSSIPSLPFTIQQAEAVPQIDRIGKTAAFHTLLQLPIGTLPANEQSPFKWWLFACNLGHHTRSVIGDGLVSAALQQNSHEVVELLITRVDDTVARICIVPQLPAGLKACMV